MAARAKSKPGSGSGRIVGGKKTRVAEPRLPRARRGVEPVAAASSPSPLSRLRADSTFRKRVFIGAIVVLLTALLFYKKSWFIAATVGNSPITNWQLQARLNRDYRAQTLDQIVNEKVILNEAKAKGALPSEQEIDIRMTEVEARFGGADNFKNLLTGQGQTTAGVREQVKLELVVEKLYSGEVSVTAQEVDDFVKNNKSSLQATDSAAQNLEAEKTLRSRKLSQTFFQKFQELKKNANVRIF